MAVAETFGGRSAIVIERHDFRGNKSGVEAITDQVSADGGDHQPSAIDRFALALGDDTQRCGGGQ